MERKQLILCASTKQMHWHIGGLVHIPKSIIESIIITLCHACRFSPPSHTSHSVYYSSEFPRNHQSNALASKPQARKQMGVALGSHSIIIWDAIHILTLFFPAYKLPVIFPPPPRGLFQRAILLQIYHITCVRITLRQTAGVCYSPRTRHKNKTTSTDWQTPCII